MDDSNWGVPEIQIKKLTEDAIVPTRANESDAGWDLYVPHDFLLPQQTRALVPTHIAMAIPNGYVGLIWDRSGLAVKKGIHRFAGVIDSGYRGEVKVCLWNSSDTEVHFNKGERIAQILFQIIPCCNLVEVEELNTTQRGEGGFGSSGK
tara:strand:+ start:275 stop:721 length:447 start_codon:yes stop_codon:yes gene_type:complete